MRRELATVLDELRSGLVQGAARAGVRVTGVEMTLPMDVLVVLRDGGLALLADVPRSRADDPWRDVESSRLSIRWQAMSPEEVERAERWAAPEPARIPTGDRPMYSSDEGLS